MRTIPVFLVLLLCVAGASAEVLVFDKYETTSHVDGNKIHIERNMVLTNVARNPVIPGELHFKIYEKDGDSKHTIQVTNFKGQNERGTQLNTKVVTKKDMSDLSVTIWDPMLPGFSYSFKISYDLYFEPSGILFYELKIPQEETTIPIRSTKQTVLLDTKYYVTYAPQTEVSEAEGKNVVSWTHSNDQQVIEYSVLPFPRTGVSGLKAFYGGLIVILAGIFIVSVYRYKKAQAQQPGV
jgi:hypothetical protein